MAAAFDLLVIVLVAGTIAGAQPPPPASGTPGTNPYFRSSKLNPSMAIIIVLLISAFFFLGFFSVYLRQCSRGNSDSFTIAAAAAAAAVGRARGQRGLDRAVLETFPILIYSEVKEHKIGKGALECAICLNEFENEEIIRLLPKCDHVFHQDCIDAWLETHVTCPVCRTNYAVDSEYPAADTVLNGEAMAPPETDPPQLTPANEEEERKELERIASRVRRSRRMSRSYSTGHSINLKEDRFKLKLPENVRKEIIAAGKLQRARTFAASGPVDPSSLRRGRTVRLGRSDRWPSFFRRSFSAKIPAWGGFKSFSRKQSGVKNPIDDPAESSTAALDRV